jgi:hypothetical protein
MLQWEYLWMFFSEADGPNINTYLNGKKYKGYEQCQQVMTEVGALGYELTGITSSFNNNGGYMKMQMIFKRPR